MQPRKRAGPTKENNIKQVQNDFELKQGEKLTPENPEMAF